MAASRRPPPSSVGAGVGAKGSVVDRPLEHCWHWSAALNEYRPESHVVQPEAPMLENVPASHSEQVEDPLLEYEPPSHSVHWLLPLSPAYFPSSHEVQLSARLLEYLPASHDVLVGEGGGSGVAPIQCEQRKPKVVSHTHQFTERAAE